MSNVFWLFISLISCVVGNAFSTSVSPAGEALHLDWIDSKVNPSDNFYKYANGGWQAQHPIPTDYASWSTFHALDETTQRNIHRLLIDASTNKPMATNHSITNSSTESHIEQLVGDFYFSGMNQTRIEQQGITPLKPELDRLEAIHSINELPQALAHLHLIGVNALFAFGSMQDFKNSKHVIAAILQGGLTLPDRDYYLDNNPRFKAIRAAYRTHLKRMFELLGESKALAANHAETVLQIETDLARASLSQIAQRDPNAVYHKMKVGELTQLTPSFSWAQYFTAIQQPKLASVNVGMPSFMKALDQEWQQRPYQEWVVYLRWHLLHTFASYLSQPFVDEQFQLTRALTGVTTLLPRWKRVVAAENDLLGFAVGELYAKRYFSASSKKAVLDLVKNINSALRDDLKTLPWMTPATRQSALRKLHHMNNRVGYPDQWWDYSSLHLTRDSYASNALHAMAFLVQRDFNKIGKPVDPSEWEMSPQTINAYYNPSMNGINFPMGILQPPFFDAKAPAAVNYGSIGFVIGHEITHGFDDQGAQFDENGNLHDWWTPVDLKTFKIATQCIADQFSTYQVADQLPVKGSLVVGEATADLGGLTLAYRAFHASDAYRRAKTIDGLTPDQQFFLSAAHAWANNTRTEMALRLITADPHPPAMYRVNGTLANMPEFQAAFHIPNNSPMVNPHRCVIW